MTFLRSVFHRAALFAAVITFASSLAPSLSAQQGAASIANLPPALRAAVLAGNADQIKQAISALSGGNPTQAATLATSVVAAAEQLLATNPRAAVNAASAALQAVSSQVVTSSSPAQTLNVAAAAARIFVSPDVQRVAPQVVADGAAIVTRIVTTPAVYQASPAAAIAVMANAYSAATSQAVAAVAPGAAATVTATLNQAAANGTLNAANQANAAQIAEILAGTNNNNNTVTQDVPTPNEQPVVVEQINLPASPT